MQAMLFTTRNLANVVSKRVLVAGMTLAFNASKDSCPSLIEKRGEFCKGVDYEAIDRHKAQGGLTLAFNASKDSCPSLTEKRIELCKKFDYEAIERRKAA